VSLTRLSLISQGRTELRQRRAALVGEGHIGGEASKCQQAFFKKRIFFALHKNPFPAAVENNFALAPLKAIEGRGLKPARFPFEANPCKELAQLVRARREGLRAESL
jgi:hypothetical protein